MHGHFRVQAPDAPAGSAKSDAQLRIFGRNHVCPKAAHLLESVDTHQRIASAALGLSYRGIPLDVAKHIVNRSRRITLPTPATDNCYIAVRLKKGHRFLDPAGNNFAITIDKLDIEETGLQLTDALKTFVSRTCGSKGNSSVEFDDVTTCTSRL